MPAAKKIYALRDVTATVDSIPLIAASIMSKKLSEGIDGFVLDIKTGNGAFMQDLIEAKKLARLMIKIGEGMNIRVKTLITNMDQPLGRAVGNSLEVEEAINALKGKGPEDLLELTYALAQEMLKLAGIRTSKREIEKRLKNGEALEKLRELIKLQGGNPKAIDDPSILPKARYEIEVKALKQGWVSEIDTLKIGLLLNEIGGGRKKKGDKIDHSVGFIFFKKLGDYIKKGDTLAKIFIQDRSLREKVSKELWKCYKIRKKGPILKPLIITSI